MRIGGEAAGGESGPNDLRTDSGLITESNADATAHRALSARRAEAASNAIAGISDPGENRVRSPARGGLEGPDVGLLAKTGEPELLLPLLFFLHQFLFNLGAQLVERRRV